MMKLKSYIRYLLIRILCRNMAVYADGTDGSLTVNPPLFRALSIVGIHRHNSIYTFRVGGQYAFSVYPRFETDWTRLEKSADGDVGFVPATPNLAQMLYYSRLPYDFKGIVGVRVGIKRDIIYFTLSLP